MLPDFPLPLPGLGAGDRVLIARDVAAAVFFYGFPPTVPFTECFERESREGQARLTARLQAWLDGLLGRVVVQPRLTVELVHRLGPAREAAALTYLRTIGWLAADEDSAAAAGELLLPIRIETEAVVSAGAALRPWVVLPEPTLKGAIRLLAAKARVLPSVLWALPISEFIFNWRIVLQDELLERVRPWDEAEDPDA